MDCVISRILQRSSTRSRTLKSYALRWGMGDHHPWQNVYDIAVPDHDLELYVKFCADVITAFRAYRARRYRMVSAERTLADTTPEAGEVRPFIVSYKGQSKAVDLPG